MKSICKLIWDHIDQLSLEKETRYHLAHVVFALLFTLIGSILWLLLKQFYLVSSIESLILLAGYPALFSGIFVFLYEDRHSLKD